MTGSLLSLKCHFLGRAFPKLPAARTPITPCHVSYFSFCVILICISACLVHLTLTFLFVFPRLDRKLPKAKDFINLIPSAPAEPTARKGVLWLFVE